MYYDDDDEKEHNFTVRPFIHGQPCKHGKIIGEFCSYSIIDCSQLNIYMK